MIFLKKELYNICKKEEENLERKQSQSPWHPINDSKDSMGMQACKSNVLHNDMICIAIGKMKSENRLNAPMNNGNPNKVNFFGYLAFVTYYIIARFLIHLDNTINVK